MSIRKRKICFPNNMGESSEMVSEDDKALSDKNRKRTLKTRSQIEALESFYDEHKYPTESMKLLVADRIGLSEKQISSWFCHRRLKDKKILNGEVHVNGSRHDRLSGVIQDLGCGPRQDSCGSTKQSDDRNQGPVEVQSKRINGLEVFAADLTERSSRYTGSHSHMDETSSGCSSLPPNMCCEGDPMHMVTSRCSTQSIAYNVKSGKPRCGPSGYLKVKGRVENAAITAVKRQLGMLYREDGPPLSIEFDPLRQEEFESSTQQPSNNLSETYYAEEIVPHYPSDATNMDQQYLSKPYHVKEHNLSLLADFTRIHKQTTSSKGYEYTSNLSSHKAVEDGESSQMTRGSEHSRSSFSQMAKQEFSLSDHTAIDMHEDSSQEIPRYDRRNHNEMSTMLGDCGFRMGAPQHFQPLGGEVNPEQGEFRSSHERRRKIGHGDRHHSSYSDMTIEEPESDAFKDQGVFRKAAKV